MMKKLLLTLMAAILIWSGCLVNAQESIDNLYVSPTGWARYTTTTTAFESFYEDFESGAFPAGWTIYHDDATASDDSQWNVAQQSAWGGYVAYDGTKAAFSNGCESHGVNYYLVTKAINFHSSAYLNYYYIAPDYWGDINTLKVAYSENPTGPWTYLWSTEGIDYPTWTENTIDLSSLDGTYYLAFVNANDFGYCVAIDNVSLTETRNTREIQYYSLKLNGTEVGTTVNPYFQFDTENLVDGQTYTASVAVMSTETGLSEYVDYQFTFSSPENYEGVSNYSYDVVDGNVILSWTMPDGKSAMIFQDGELITETPLTDGSYTIDGPIINTIDLCIRAVVTDENSDDYYAMSAPQCVSVNTECPAPKDLYGEDHWSGEQFGARLIWPYGGTTGSEFSEGFEDGIPSSWATIDADGDGYNWERGSVLMAGHAIHSHTGEDMVSSQSWIAGSVGALTPDNYLVTERVNIVNGSKISFWACGQDITAVAEHFGVAISTGIQTNPDAFTTIAEWTMNAKEVGSYYHYEVDLSEYAGQKVYLAIRHFNCTDMFILNVDDVELTVSGSKAYTSTFDHFNIYRNDEKIAETTANSYFDIMENVGTYKYQVTAVYSTEGEDCESGFANSYENPDEDYVEITVTSVEDNPESTISIYPNPASNTLNINAAGMRQIAIYDIVGRKVFENVVASDEATINVNNFESGVYVVRISTEMDEIVKRISIVR